MELAEENGELVSVGTSAAEIWRETARRYDEMQQLTDLVLNRFAEVCRRGVG